MIKADLQQVFQVYKPDLYVAPWPVELVSTMPAAHYEVGQDRQFVRIAHLLVPDLLPGDKLLCSGSFGMTNDLPFLVELAAGLLLTPSATGTCGLELLPSVSDIGVEPSGGRFITRFVGFNVTPNEVEPQFPHGGMHHALWHLTKGYVVPQGVNGDHYVAIIAYCAGEELWPTSDIVTIEPMCSDLSVMRFR